MDSYFIIQHCRGPFKNLTEAHLLSSVEYIFDDISADLIGDFWEEFSFAEELLEQAASTVSEQSIMSQDEDWLNACRKIIIREVFMAAKRIYLEDRNDATQRFIGDSSWILSGGITWDGDSTEAAEYIRLIRWSGLDEYLHLNHSSPS